MGNRSGLERPPAGQSGDGPKGELAYRPRPIQRLGDHARCKRRGDAGDDAQVEIPRARHRVRRRRAAARACRKHVKLAGPPSRHRCASRRRPRPARSEPSTRRPGARPAGRYREPLSIARCVRSVGSGGLEQGEQLPPVSSDRCRCTPCALGEVRARAGRSAAEAGPAGSAPRRRRRAARRRSCRPARRARRLAVHRPAGRDDEVGERNQLCASTACSGTITDAARASARTALLVGARPAPSRATVSRPTEVLQCLRNSGSTAGGRATRRAAAAGRRASAPGRSTSRQAPCGSGSKSPR